MSEQLNLELDGVAQHTTTQHRAPYGIHGNKFPGVIWPDPTKMTFTLEREYDPMSLINREKPLRKED